MKIEIKPSPDKPGVQVVTPHGPIDSDTYLDFQNGISALLTKETKSILVDLRDVDYISSAGLGVLFTTKKFLVQNGGDLYFCNLKPQIVRLFEIVKALPIAQIFATTEEADRYFYKMMNEEIEKQKKR